MSTEREMLDLLVTRYHGLQPHGGNSQMRYTFGEHVRSHAGFDAKRTADFIAMDLWPSTGLQLHGHEVKVSRSDWLTELKCPEKSEEFKQYMDRWWLVISDASFVKPGELPKGWGMLAPSFGRLRVVRVAPRLTPLPMPKTQMACLLRSVTKTTLRIGCAA